MTEKNIFPIFFLSLVAGVLLELYGGRFYAHLFKKKFKTHHFFFSRYIYLLLFPILATIFVATSVRQPIWSGFVMFAILGTLLEFLLGFAYENIVGQRLWTYHRYALGRGYTSLLSIPLWGIAGVFFWLLSQTIY